MALTRLLVSSPAWASLPLQLLRTFGGYVELIGGILLIVGLGTNIASLLLSVVMAGAIYFVHLKDGFLSVDGGGL